eukprot:5686256-Amphidinium_carterae.1
MDDTWRNVGCVLFEKTIQNMPLSQGKTRLANLTKLANPGKRATKHVRLLQHESDERSQAFGLKIRD